MNLKNRLRSVVRTVGMTTGIIVLIAALQSGAPRLNDHERSVAEDRATDSGMLPSDPAFRITVADPTEELDPASSAKDEQNRPLLSLHPSPDTVVTSTTNARRAVLSYDAMQTALYLPEVHLYLETQPKVLANDYAWVWPLSQVFAGTIDLATLPGVGDAYRNEATRRLAALELYWAPENSPPAYSSYVLPPLGAGGAVFYDDNAWIGLELIRWYRLTGDPAILDRARLVFDYVASGWEDDPTVAAPGGVFWTKASGNQNRNTVSTAPGAELALHLYEITGEATYLDWGQRMYDWVQTHMLGPDGLFWDHMDLVGNFNTSIFSYNQGAMIAANVMLHRVTADAMYLERAEEIARRSLEKYASGAFDDQSIYINTIFFKKLLMLREHNANDSYITAMQDYADRMWESRVNAETHLMQTNDLHILIDQAAVVQLYATLAAVEAT